MTSKTINIRVTSQQKAELKAMAKSLQMSLSGFLRQSAIAEANAILHFRKRIARPMLKPSEGKP